jgi:hypothetical protein
MWKTRSSFSENRVLDARTFADLLSPGNLGDSINRKRQAGNNPSTGFPQECVRRKMLPVLRQERVFLSHAHRQR